jgi:hypothetical protein
MGRKHGLAKILPESNGRQRFCPLMVSRDLHPAVLHHRIDIRVRCKPSCGSSPFRVGTHSAENQILQLARRHSQRGATRLPPVISHSAFILGSNVYSFTKRIRLVLHLLHIKSSKHHELAGGHHGTKALARSYAFLRTLSKPKTRNKEHTKLRSAEQLQDRSNAHSHELILENTSRKPPQRTILCESL